MIRHVAPAEPTYPHITLNLVGLPRNGLVVLGRFHDALANGGVSPEACARALNDAAAGDFDHLLSTVMQHVQVC